MGRLLFNFAVFCFAGVHLADACPYAYLTANYSPAGPVIPNANKVSVLNWQTGKLVTMITLKSAATLTAANPNGRFVYIIDGPAGQQEVSVISTATNAVVRTFPITNDVTKTFVWHAAFLAVSPDGNTIWVGNGDNTVSIYCAKSYVLLAKITLPLTGGHESSLVFSPDGARAYVPYSNINSSVGAPAILVLSAISRKVIKTLAPSVPYYYYGTPAISKDGRFLYLMNAGDVYVVSTTDGSTVTVIPDIASGPQPITISPNGQQLWFGSFVSEVSGDQSEVDVADTASNGIIKRFINMRAVSLAITPDGKSAWVLQNNSITPVSTDTFEIGSPIALPASPSFGSIVFVE